MSVEQPKSKLALSSKALINLQDQYLNCLIMDVRTAKNQTLPRKSGIGIPLVEGNKLEYCRSFSQGHGGRSLFRYFTLKSLILLVCLTASLLILPLILPPLPPPPFMLLMIPICILALLMLLALMPSNIRETCTYV